MPIYYGAPNAKDHGLPEHSFIDANDFARDYTITVNVTSVPAWTDKDGRVHAGEGKVQKNYKELGLVKGYGVVRYGVGEASS